MYVPWFNSLKISVPSGSISLPSFVLHAPPPQMPWPTWTKLPSKSFKLYTKPKLHSNHLGWLVQELEMEKSQGHYIWAIPLISETSAVTQSGSVISASCNDSHFHQQLINYNFQQIG